jgi:hypothetical protein
MTMKRYLLVCLLPLLLARSAFAVGSRYVADGDPLEAGDAVAILPPVRGG